MQPRHRLTAAHTLDYSAGATRHSILNLEHENKAFFFKRDTNAFIFQMGARSTRRAHANAGIGTAAAGCSMRRLEQRRACTVNCRYGVTAGNLMASRSNSAASTA